MSPLTCAEVRDAASEYALDILTPPERSAVASHLLRCPGCRAEVDSMSAVGTQLLQLVPGTEPPLGFDHRVMARVGAHRHSWAGRARRHPRILGSVAAAAALVFGLMGWMAGRTETSHNHLVLTAALHQGTRTVGQVEAFTGHPGWLNMTVHGLTSSGWVDCRVVEKDGDVVQVGSFGVPGGSGSWSVPNGKWASELTGVRLVDANGQVVATAVFH